MDRCNNRLDTAEEKISELEEITKETQRKSSLKKMKRTLVTCRTRLRSQIDMKQESFRKGGIEDLLEEIMAKCPQI